MEKNYRVKHAQAWAVQEWVTSWKRGTRWRRTLELSILRLGLGGDG